MVDYADHKFPEIGCGKRYLVTMDGAPWAGFDDLSDAQKAQRMYQTSNAAKGLSAGSQRNWGITDRGVK